MSGALWSPAELERALGAAPSTALGAEVVGVSIDTRTLAPGDLFFAIAGDVHDGHDHVAKAFAAGAAAAVVGVARRGQLAALGPAFGVDDTLRAMRRLGAAARARSSAGIVGVTGSVGKTSVKEMLRVALGAAGEVHASAASYNNHWGVPLSLARLPQSAAFGVFEIGMNHAGEIAPLAALARPHVALVTTIAPVHLEHLGSLEAIARAKAEIFGGLEPGGVAVLNGDAPHCELLAAAARAAHAQVRRFGAGAGSDAELLSYVETAGGAQVRGRIGGRALSFALGAPGRHHAQNAFGVLLAAEAMGVDPGMAAAALAAFAPPKGRGERLVLQAPDGPFTLIDESYNANPASMRAALALLGAAKPGAGGRRVAVIGDMLELGQDGPAMHAALAQDLSRENVDLLFGAGPLTRHLFDAAPAARRGAWAASAADMRPALIQALRGGDVVMVKGSNGSRMGPLVAALIAHFSPVAARAAGENRC